MCNWGEYCVFSSTGYTGAFLDDYWASSDYAGDEFLNPNLPLNDNVESGTNAATDMPLRAYRHSGYDGSGLKFLIYPDCNATLCHSYSSLGWANNITSSHKWVTS